MIIDWTSYLIQSLIALPLSTILWSVYAYYRISERDWRHAIRSGIMWGIFMAVWFPLIGITFDIAGHYLLS